MVIVDTSVWVDSVRARDERLVEWMAADLVLQHPLVTAEFSMGSFRSAAERARMIDLLESFEQVEVADFGQFHAFVADRALFGTGIGLVDAHLLQTCSANPHARLATRDKRLIAQAERLGISLMN